MQQNKMQTMTKFSAGLVLFAMAVVLTMYASCAEPLDWKNIKYPCDAKRTCLSGYSCVGGLCVSGGGGGDAGPTPETPFNPDGPYRPPLKEPKIAFLYVGPVGDFGWTWAHEQGRLHLKKLGYKTTFAGPVSVKDTPDQIEKFIKSGYNVISGTSYDFLVPTLTMADKYPNVNFLTCSGFRTAKNLGAYFGRIYQLEWIAGMIAGAVTKSNRIGIVATVPIAEVVRHINAFTLGVRKRNPKAVVIVKWVGNWFDPKVEPVLTKELLDENTDVIHPLTDTSIPMELIENKGKEPLTTKDGDKVYTIGHNASNACDFGPRTCLVTPYWNWGAMVGRIVEQMKSGTWDPKKVIWESVRADSTDSGFALTKISSVVPGPARIEIESLIPKLAKEKKNGEQLAFEPPLVDNKGKQRFAKGKYPTDEDMLNMCWYVEGVVEKDGKTPAKVPAGCKGDR